MIYIYICVCVYKPVQSWEPLKLNHQFQNIFLFNKYYMLKFVVIKISTHIVFWSRLAFQKQNNAFGPLSIQKNKNKLAILPECPMPGIPAISQSLF